MVNTEFKSISELVKVFYNDQVCVEYLEKLRWAGNIISPFDSSSKVYKCSNNKYRCKNTGKYFNVKTYTLFDNSKIELSKWLLAIYIVTEHKGEMSSLQLSKDLGITQKSAWLMLQRIKICYSLDKF